MNENQSTAFEKKEFTNGAKPEAADFKEMQDFSVKLKDDEGETYENKVPMLVDIDTISGTDTKGNPVRYVLLSDKKILTVRQGRGRDVQRATMEANGDQSALMSALMAATVYSEDNKLIGIVALEKLIMKDYMSVQVAFSDLNF